MWKLNSLRRAVRRFLFGPTSFALANRIRRRRARDRAWHYLYEGWL